jgi:hypothetical protein
MSDPPLPAPPPRRFVDVVHDAIDPVADRLANGHVYGHEVIQEDIGARDVFGNDIRPDAGRLHA